MSVAFVGSQDFADPLTARYLCATRYGYGLDSVKVESPFWFCVLVAIVFHSPIFSLFFVSLGGLPLVGFTASTSPTSSV